MKPWLISCVFVAASLAASNARAQMTAQVGVEGDASDNPARAKVVEELRSQGYDVREPGQVQEDGTRPLSARLIVQGRSIVVRVIVRRRGHYERREAEIELGQTEEEQTTAALRAAEFLRVSLLDLGAEAPARPEPPPTVLPFEDKPKPMVRHAVHKDAPLRGPGIGMYAGGALGYSTGGFSAQPWFTVGLSLPVATSVRARVFGMVPMAAASSQAPEGELRLSTTLVGPSVGWAALRGRYAELELEGGVAGVAVSISAQANPGHWSENSTRYAAMPLAGARVMVLPGRFRVGLGALCGTLLPREEVRAAGREVSTWGGFVGAASLQVEVALD
ncbi:MAG: hypothetical protein HY898_03310 [Deltaproteobacteria bacterium]|nr:hypothetical protein [Deltaproteobacteria bacterium]